MTFTRLLCLATLLASSACSTSVETTEGPSPEPASTCAWDANVKAFTSGWSTFDDAQADHTDMPRAIDASADGWHTGDDFNLYLVSSAPMDIRGVHVEVLSGAVSDGSYVILWGEAENGAYVLSGTMEGPLPIVTRDLAFRDDLADNVALWNRTALRVMLMPPEGADPVVKVTPLCE